VFGATLALALTGHAIYAVGRGLFAASAGVEFGAMTTKHAKMLRVFGNSSGGASRRLGSQHSS
jgi:hypothetical protein